MRQGVVLGMLLAIALTTGGCVQAVTGDTITFVASEASIEDGTLQRTGYQLENTDTVEVDREVDLPVVGKRHVEITNHVTSYAKADGEGGTGEANAGGVLVVLSTPQAQVAGQGTNPLGRMPLEELVTQVASRAGDQGDLEKVGNETVTVLGTTTEVEKFATTTERDGESVETFVYVTRVPHGDDYVIAAAVLPQAFADAEEDAIYALMEGIEHEGE